MTRFLMFNWAQIFTVDFNNQEKLILVKVRHWFKLRIKIQFQNSILDCDKVESNSSCWCSQVFNTSPNLLHWDKLGQKHINFKIFLSWDPFFSFHLLDFVRYQYSKLWLIKTLSKAHFRNLFLERHKKSRQKYFSS